MAESVFKCSDHAKTCRRLASTVPSVSLAPHLSQRRSQLLAHCAAARTADCPHKSHCSPCVSSRRIKLHRQPAHRHSVTETRGMTSRSGRSLVDQRRIILCQKLSGRGQKTQSPFAFCLVDIGEAVVLAILEHVGLQPIARHTKPRRQSHLHHGRSVTRPSSILCTDVSPQALMVLAERRPCISPITSQRVYTSPEPTRSEQAPSGRKLRRRAWLRTLSSLT